MSGMNALDTTTTVPLLMGEDEVIRISQTRVTLDTVVSAFKSGSTAEEIVFQYPTLDLADVYAVIGYYLKNQSAVELYLQTAETVSAKLRLTIQQKFPATDIRQRLLARLTGTSKSDV